jgi:hypothetical protein
VDKKCGICGRDNVDILCSKCGTFICERCYDPETDTCIRCSGKQVKKPSSENRILQLVGGAMLVMMGLFVSSFAFIPLTNAKIVVFPFMFENLNSVTAVLMSLMFFCMFAVTSLLPFYFTLRRNRLFDWDEGIYTLQESHGSGSNVTETVEYMITTEVPEKLKETIYIEDNLDEVVLRSEKDPGFLKSYNIPDSYIIDSVESAYEDGFLLLKVKLVRD